MSQRRFGWLKIDCDFAETKLPPRRIAGIALGLAGLVVMFNLTALNWRDYSAIFGNGLLLLSALAWSVSILYTRAHRWIATPFQLVLWEVLLAAIILTTLALIFEGSPKIVFSTPLLVALGYSGAPCPQGGIGRGEIFVSTRNARSGSGLRGRGR